MKQHVIDVNEATFDAQVVQQSHSVPVLVDFWAAWCGPCKALTPILEDLARLGGGKWILAKVNSDENPKLASAFQVRGIPNVKAFRDGKVVDEFTGLLPRNAVERFLARLVPSEVDEGVTEAVRQLERGELPAARTTLEAALSQQPGHDGGLLALAKLELLEGHADQALALLEKLPDSGAVGAAARALRAEARFASAPAGESLDTLAARVAADPKDLDARFALALALAKRGELDRTAEELLTILGRKRDYQDGAARRALLDVVELLGPQDERAEKYRSRLSSVLFS